MKARTACLFAFVISALTITAALGLEAQKIAEVAKTTQSATDFLKHLPGAFEFQLFYMLAGSGVAGAVASWLWKWSQGNADAHHFTLRYAVGQLLWIGGSSITAIVTIGFSTASGEFFGWWSVIYAGALAGFGGEIKNVRQEWSDAKRLATEIKAAAEPQKKDGAP